MRIFVPSAARVLTDGSGNGEGLIAWNVLRGLARRGHELVVCAPRVELASEPPFEVRELGAGSGLESVAPLAYARAARLEGAAARADVWHWLFPQLPEHVALPAGAAPLVVGPWFETWPNGSRPRRPGDAVRAALGPYLSVRNRRALARGRLLVTTPAAAERFDRVATRLVPIGVDADAFAPTPPPADGPVLFVGRLVEAKGVRELLEAFALVRRELPAVRLRLAGEGPEREWVERRKGEADLAGAVELLGAVAPAAMAGLLREASLVCAPSHGEPYGMAILEAMAAGRAVVATDAGGPRFLVGPESGCLVPVGDAQALADALASLLRDPARLERAGRAARERVEQELSLERMLDSLEAVYAEAAR